VPVRGSGPVRVQFLLLFKLSLNREEIEHPDFRQGVVVLLENPGGSDYYLG
jgi:hypothetical protein